MRLAVVLTIVATLNGCGTTPTTINLQSAWYLTYEDQSQKQPKLFIAIINRDSGPVTVSKVMLNGSLRSSYMWERNGDLTLEPGRLYLIPSDKFAKNQNQEEVLGGCWLPVSVFVHRKQEGKQSLEEEPIPVELIGRMPSSLPDNWVKNCLPVETSSSK